MGGSQRTQSRGSNTSTSSQTTTESGGTSSQLGSTPTAMEGLPGFQSAFNESLGVGPYTGDVAAGFDYSGPITPVQRDVNRFVAGPGSGEREGLNMASQGIDSLTGGAGQDYIGDTARNVGQYWAGVTEGGPEGILTSAPYQTLLSSLSGEAQETLDRQNSNISNIFAGSGGWAGTEQARAAGFATEETMEALAQQQAALGWEAFNLGHDLMGRAPAGAGQALGLAQAPGLAQAGIGQEQRGLDQLALDEDLAQANWLFDQQNQGIQNELFQAGVGQANEQADLTNAQALNEALRTGDLGLYQQFFDTLTSGVFGQDTTASATSTSSGRQSGTSTSTGTGTDSGQAVSNAGSLISAAALAAMAFWSDGRLKENERFLGERKGVRWYEFEFTAAAREMLGLPSGKHIGVIAQELLQGPMRDAVFAFRGLLAVDYAKVL